MYQKRYTKDLGERIRIERKLRKWTARDLAERIDDFWNISSNNNHNGKRTVVARWENDTATPSLNDAIAMCSAFEVDLDYMLGHTPFRKREERAITERTGLTEESLFILQELHNNRIHPNISDIINQLLSSNDGIQLLESLYNWNKQREG